MNTNSKSQTPGPEGPVQLHLGRLRLAVISGRYKVPAERVAEALVLWHAGFSGGRLSHEAAPLDPEWLDGTRL